MKNEREIMLSLGLHLLEAIKDVKTKEKATILIDGFTTLCEKMEKMEKGHSILGEKLTWALSNLHDKSKDMRLKHLFIVRHMTTLMNEFAIEWEAAK